MQGQKFTYIYNGHECHGMNIGLSAVFFSGERTIVQHTSLTERISEKFSAYVYIYCWFEINVVSNLYIKGQNIPT